MQPKDPVWNLVRVIEEAATERGKPNVECKYCDAPAFIAGDNHEKILLMLSMLVKNNSSPAAEVCAATLWPN